jgi:penicillin-binding protein 2
MSDNSRVRVSIVGVVVVALFASLFARLWFLQMGPDQALGNVVSTYATRVIQTESPRGEILDRNGKVLAQDVASWAVTVDRNLPNKTVNRVLGSLAEVLGVPQKTLRANYDSVRQSPLKPAVVALNVPLPKQLAIREHSEDYPGVNVAELTVRQYSYDGLASQLLGYLGEVDALDPKQYKALKKRGYQPGDLIGRDGVEAAYESVLRGKPTLETVQVDPTGKQVGPPISVQPGEVGNNVKLSIDIDWQRAAEKALAEGIAAARTKQDPANTATGYHLLNPTGGAVVAMDVHTGAVVAMASNPTYPLSVWTGGISSNAFSVLTNPGANTPLLNRATEGLYAPGSTFKLVPSVALNKYGLFGASQYFDDQGSIPIGDRVFHNDNGAINGSVNLAGALTVSSDVYFYNAGNLFWQHWYAGDQQTGLGIQQVASQLGFGHLTGVELNEAAGRIPDPAWKKAFSYAINKTPQAQQENSLWNPGDNVNAAIGQGDDVVTPLQLADAYGMFANAATNNDTGTLWTPHVAEEVIDPMTKKVVRVIRPKARGTITIDPFTYSQIAAGFSGAVHDTRGTAYQAFHGLFVNVAGKTGTAQVVGKGPTSLFASYFPADNPQYVVVAVVEQGGHGAETAAPIVRQVIEAIEGITPVTPIPTGSSGSD